MAFLYISEFSEVYQRRDGILMARQPSQTDQTPVVIGAGHLESAAFGAATSFVRLESDAVCSFVIGMNPVATANNARMAAGAFEYFAVNPGDKVSVIQNT